MNKKSDDVGQYSDEETARRRDETIRRMITAPPQPHKPLGKPKAKESKRRKPSKRKET
jgi:hypothetical protein